MGETSYLHLPPFVAVQVSAERWQIAELTGEAIGGEGHRAPTYKALPEKMTQGNCNNKLCELQRAARKAKAVRQ